MAICASTPNITNSIDGGMMGDSRPPAAVNAAANERSYPSFSISGTMTRDITAIWATADPMIEAIIMLTTRLM